MKTTNEIEDIGKGIFWACVGFAAFVILFGVVAFLSRVVG